MFIKKAVWFQKFQLLVIITEKVRQALNKDEFACDVFLDSPKAFDAVNHNTLIAKLNHYGIRGITLDYFQSYQTN